MFSDERFCLKTGFSDNAGITPAKKQIVIFTSESLVAHLHLNDLMPFFLKAGIEPVIFITPSSKSPRAQIPSLQHFEFYDVDILNDVIFPTLESSRGKKAVSLTPTFNQLMQRYSCTPQKVDTLKDPAILEAINAPNNIGAISIYQDAIFKPDLITAIQEKGFLWNLHPAVLPQDRGVWVIFWSMLQEKEHHGYTLHEIDTGIDTGRIVATHKGVLSPQKSVFESYVDFVKGGSKLVQQALSTYLREGKVEGVPQSSEPVPYYSFPTEDDIGQGWEKGVRLWGTPEEMLSIYTRLFGNDEALSAKIRKAIARHEGIENPVRQYSMQQLMA